jgi:hypothetical protein
MVVSIKHEHGKTFDAPIGEVIRGCELLNLPPVRGIF